MRVLVIVKSTPEIEAGELPSTDMLEQMTRFNEELVRAGVMLAGEGLLASSTGRRVLFDGDRRTVVDGPFAEAKELVAGFWLWQVRSLDEAVEWAKRCPNPSGETGQLEIRQVAENEDFGDQLTPELRDAEARLRAEVASRG